MTMENVISHTIRIIHLIAIQNKKKNLIQANGEK